MQYPLSYYEKRNRLIVRAYENGTSVDRLCSDHGLKKRRMTQILRDCKVDPKKEKTKSFRSPEDILKSLGVTRYRIRGDLIRACGFWPY